MNIDKITRFGRSFSIVRVPYSFKLLMQELMTMNVSMRIITEDNIDQLDSMSYSKTINKLTFNDTPQTTDVIASVIEFNKEKSSIGYIASRASRKDELDKIQDNTNAILLDNQKAQEKMLKDIENLGWRLDSRELIEGEEGAQKRYRYVFASLILDDRGSPTEIWDGPSGGYGQFPNTHPVGWAEKDLVYPSGERIPNEIMANELARNQTPNNWLSSYLNIAQEYQKVMYRKKVLEEAKQRAEQGIEQGIVQTVQLPVPVNLGTPVSPGYESLSASASSSTSASSGITGSPGYTSIMSPVYGNSPVTGASLAQPLTFGNAAMSLQGQPIQTVQPSVVIPNPLVPVAFTPNPMVVPQAQQQAPASQGILSVEKKTEEKDEEKEGDTNSKKKIVVNLSQ